MASPLPSTSSGSIKFSPSLYLKGLGWKGEGTGLTSAPHARSRPVTVAQKKGFSGVGKDRDTSFAWWDMVFETVAKKAGKEGGAQGDKHHRTSTGILSPLPPPKPSAYTAPSALNTTALADAKMEAARRQLYSGFLRGEGLSGSLDEEDDVVVVVSTKEESARDQDQDQKTKKQKKSKRRKADADALPTPSDSDSPPPPAKKRKAPKRAGRKDHLSPEEALAAEEAAYAEAREIARRAAKAERKLARVVERALREKKAG